MDVVDFLKMVREEHMRGKKQAKDRALNRKRRHSRHIRSPRTDHIPALFFQENERTTENHAHKLIVVKNYKGSLLH
jgi:hypothetical protein